MATLEALWDLARADLNEPDTDFFTNADMVKWSNEWEDDCARRTLSIETSTTVTTVADQRTYSLPAAFLETDSVTWEDDDGDAAELDNVSKGELKDEDSTWRDADSGSPSRWYLDGDTTLGLHPPPKTAGRTVTIYYRSLQATAFVAASPSTQTPAVATRFHNLGSKFIASRMARSDGQRELANRLMGEYENEMAIEMTRRREARNRVTQWRRDSANAEKAWRSGF